MPAAITSRANPRLKQLRAAITGQRRLAAGLVALEGEHLVLEALRSGLTLETLFLTPGHALPPNLPPHTQILELPEDLFRATVETQSPQGIAALLQPPTHTLAAMLHGTPLLVIAAGLQDPGNLGTLIRSAEAFGATGVLLASGTVSPWNGKALRASAGSVFRVPTAPATPDTIATLRQQGVQFLAALKDNATSLDDPALKPILQAPCAILLGNEGAGLTPDWLALADHRITIPCPGPVESLNAAVAGSILLYAISRLRADAADGGKVHP